MPLSRKEFLGVVTSAAIASTIRGEADAAQGATPAKPKKL